MTTQSNEHHDSCWFIFQNNQLLLLSEDDHLIKHPSHLLTMLQGHFIRQFSLGLINQYPCYCAELSPDFALPATLQPTSLRKAFELLSMTWYNTIAKSSCLIQWDNNHRFCGRCGHETLRQTNVFERTCPNCSLVHYPRISPSIIVLIRNHDELLMTRSPHFPAGAYGLIAGFVEVGESIEDAVHREVMEEVGITIKHLTYITSQSWPFPDSLMIGFMADYDHGTITPDPKEIETAGWYHYNQLPGRPSTTVSIAHQLMELFIAERRALHDSNQPL